jgi:hypothetical protein
MFSLYSTHRYTDLVFILFYRTSSLFWCHLHQVARPLSSSGVTFGEPPCGFIFTSFWLADLPMALSLPAFGRRTFLWLRHCFYRVARPPSGFVVAFVRSLDLPSAPSSLCQVARPLSGSVVVFVRSLHLPPALSWHSSARYTFLRLRRHVRRVATPSSDSAVTFASSEDLLSDFILLAPSFYNFASYILVDGCKPTAWQEFYSAAS